MRHSRRQYCLSARKIHEIVQKLPSGQITLETHQKIVVIHSVYSTYRLSIMDSADFPDPMAIRGKGSSRITIENRVLKALIKQVAFSVSFSENKPILTGISFELHRETLKLTATDGIRLASTKVSISTEHSKDTQFIIPAKNALEIIKMLQEDHEYTVISVHSNQVHFKANRLQAATLLLQGGYPPTRHLIPNTSSTEIIVNANCLLKAVERVSILAENNTLHIYTPSTPSLLLHSKTPEIGDVQEEIPLENFVGEPISLSLNSKFLLDVLRHIDCETILIRFAGHLSPIVVQPVENKTKSFYLITPIRSNMHMNKQLQ